MPPRPHRRLGLALSAVALLAVSGCASGGNHEAPGLRVSERDFKIAAPAAVRAGNLDVAVHNRGPDDHELIVVRLRDKRLPLRADGLTVDEDAIEHDTVGALEPAAPGVHDLKLRLQPGRYELLCNMYGHYAGGMHRLLVVSS